MVLEADRKQLEATGSNIHQSQSQSVLCDGPYKILFLRNKSTPIDTGRHGATRGEKYTLLTFNQVVPGSIPGAPSKNIEWLAAVGRLRMS